MEARFARILVLTGTCLSIIFLPFALFAHNRLYSNDLGRAAELGRSLREDLAAPAGPVPETPPTSAAGGALDPVDLALAKQPAVIEVDATAFFDDADMRCAPVRSAGRPSAPVPGRIRVPVRIRKDAAARLVLEGNDLDEQRGQRGGGGATPGHALER